jgi:hypothetical protein
MNDMTIFKTGLPTFLKALQDDTSSSLAGEAVASGPLRISLKGGAFRMMQGNKEIHVSEDRMLNAVIIKAHKDVQRWHFGGAYVEGQNAQPKCWSTNSATPDAEVPAADRQATKCMDCPQNVKGSGQGDGRACTFHKRIAVMLEGEIEQRKVYQMVIPAKSVFGDAEGGKMPLKAYGSFLDSHKLPAVGLVTEMRFDINSPTPKLFFKPVRPVTEEEFEAINEMRNSSEAAEAVSFNTGGAKPAPVAPLPAAFDQPAPKPAAKAAPKVVEPVAEEAVEEPKVAPKKATASAAADLSDLVNGWDD